MQSDSHGGRRLREILDAMFAFVAVLSRDGVILDVNDAPLRAYGLTREQVLGTLFVDGPGWARSPEVREQVRQALARAAGGESVRARMLVEFPADRRVEMDAAFEPLRDANGQVVEIVASGVDVSEQARATRDLQRLLQQHAAIADLGSLALRTQDCEALFSRVVETVAHVLGAPLCKILERDPDDTSLLLRAGVGWQSGLVGQARVPTDTDSQAGFTLASAHPVVVDDLRTESRFRGPALLVDHGVISGMSVVIAGPAEPFGVLGVHTRSPRHFDQRDIQFLQSVANVVADFVQRTRIQEQLSRNERRYRTLTNTAAEMVWVADPSGGGMKFLGEPELVRHHRKHWLDRAGNPDVFPDDRAALAAAWAVSIAERTRFDFEYRTRNADGDWRTVSTRALPVLAPDGTVEEWVGITADVTEQRQLQEQLRQVQKMDAIGQLAGGIAHDFNNLLTIIGGCATLVAENVPDGTPARALIADVIDAAKRAAALTAQLLAFSRRQVTTPTVVDLTKIVVSTQSLLARLIGENINLHVTGDVGCTARVDPAQVEQIIVNLAINARDAMPEGGTLSLETRIVDPALSPVPADCGAGRQVVFIVNDTGIGMPADVRSRVFEPFFTTKAPGVGTGLGLATVYGIVKQSGGAIAVDSVPGAGTTFRVYFPLVEPAPAVEATPVDRRPDTGDETILLVEDEAGVRSFAKQVLETAGYTVVVAASGDEGGRLALAAPGPIHLLLSDVVMPGGGGRALYETVRQARPGIRVLFISGYTADEFIRKGIEARAFAFLPKPFLPEQLTRKVRQVLDA